jgi:hypothetical protein
MPMKIYYLEGKPLDGAPFEHEGIAYPGNWPELATTQELLAVGIRIEEISDPQPEPLPEGMKQIPLEDFK